jgi:predicted lipoprotein with Yx(FWY)xxD motif/nitroimidazol reductase NimA-like FMN-containing flavoprotein (pyridoxamine 5'-phosphate oxidase superfamily)
MTNTTLTRMRDCAFTDRAELDRLLDGTVLCHIGMVDDTGSAVVIPTALARDGDRILVHGSTGSGWMRRAAAGAQVCVTVTDLNGVIVARSGFESSFRYRSAALFGTFTRLPDAELPAALDVILDHLLPGRRAEIRAPHRPEQLPGDGAVNRRPVRYVVTGMGSMKGTSLPRRSWAGIAGAALLTASGAIHLDLYLTGYRTIPTIGPLFLLQVIAAFVLAVAIPLTGSWLVAAAAALFAVSTLGGYLLSLWVGLFGFTEVRTTAGIVAGLLDVAAFAALAVAAAPGLPRTLNLGRRPLPAIGAASVVALALLFAAVATPKTQPAVTGADVLKARTIGGVNLLTNADGLTLYWFAADSAGKSACYGSCAAYWPPVTGTPTAGPGVTGTLGTIIRTDGTKQATYDGHPLYTYIGDHAPGTASGNDVNLNGGLWHDVPITG